MKRYGISVQKGDEKLLGKKIKEYMNEKGIKQTFLVEKTGLSTQTVNSILNGNRKIEATEYYEICRALGLKLDYLFSTEEGESDGKG